MSGFRLRHCAAAIAMAAVLGLAACGDDGPATPPGGATLPIVQNIRRDAGPYPCWTTYPAPHQIGQGHDGGQLATEPVYIWGNTGDGNHDAPGVEDYEPDECGNGETVTDFILGPKPGYTKYTYPHPLRAQTE